MVRKIIRFANSRQQAETRCNNAKTYPGVTYTKFYMVSGSKYHVLISGEMSDEVYETLSKGVIKPYKNE